MRITEQTMSWVVYLMTLHGKASTLNAVCEQGEWEAMELARPGYHTLVQAGIVSEAAAEKLARDRTPLPTRSMHGKVKHQPVTLPGPELVA